MPDGGSTEEFERLTAGLQSEVWGVGLAHMAAVTACERCDGARFVGHPAFPLPCPACQGSGVR